MTDGQKGRATERGRTEGTEGERKAHNQGQDGGETEGGDMERG